MELNPKVIKMVEYCMCEAALDIYPKLKSKASTFNNYCVVVKQSMKRGDLSSRDERFIGHMMYCARREFRLPEDDLSRICANFFIEERWFKYVDAIQLMRYVRHDYYKLPLS